MFDLTYSNQLKYITVSNTTTTGDPAELARVVESQDRKSDPTEWTEWPEFGSRCADEALLITFDAEEGSVTWTCKLDLSALDWSHPWEDRAIIAAESIYHEHRDANDTRWTLRHIEADALRYLRQCVADCCGTMTPVDADKLIQWFLYDAMPYEAEELEETDPISELLAEAVEDAAPVSTGMPQLDAILGGGLHKGLSVIAGDPSSGKTALAIMAALYCANQRDGAVVYIMADVGGEKSALLRMISTAAAVRGVGGCDLGRAGQWSARELYEGRRAYESVTMGHMVLSGKKDVGEVLSLLGYHHRVRGVSFAALDFAQSMSREGKSLAFDPEAASLAVRELREWAHDHGAVVVLLSAYSKSASEAHSRGAKPTMSDVLGSAEMSYSAEHVLALTSLHDGSGEVTVRDLKCRHGNGKPCTLHLDAAHGLFN